jgi:hypothetical protein
MPGTRPGMTQQQVTGILALDSEHYAHCPVLVILPSLT